MYGGLESFKRLDAAEIVFQFGVSLELPALRILKTALVDRGNGLLRVYAAHITLRQVIIGRSDDRQREERLRDGVELTLRAKRVSGCVGVFAECGDIDVQIEILGDLRVDVGAHVETLVRGIGQDTVLIHHTDARIVFYAVGTSRSGDVVLVCETVVLEEQIHPVRFTVYPFFLHTGDHLIRPQRIQSVHLASLVVPADVVLGVKPLGHGDIGGESRRAVV